MQEDPFALETSDLGVLRSLVASMRRWGGVANWVIGAVLGLLLGAVVFLSTSGDWSQVAPGSIWLLLVVLFKVGEWVYANAHDLVLNRLCVRGRYELPAYRPIDSPVIQQWLRGTRRAAFTSATISTFYLVYVLLLLPHDAGLVVPFAALILGACYGTTIVHVVSDRWVVARIVGEETSRRLADLGSQIDALMVRVPDLSPEEERKLDQLRKVYEDVREAPLTPTVRAPWDGSSARRWCPRSRSWSSLPRRVTSAAC